jgi:acetyl-CoA carboxylase carboxyl transferase subunit alpha
VPTINVVIGEGGSGGALGIAMGDRVFMLQYAYYSVITPEGCSAILFKSPDRWQEAAAALRLTAGDLLGFGLIDEIIPEPVGGAHRNRKTIADGVKQAILGAIDELNALSAEDLLDRRYAKYRSISFYEESASQLYQELDLGAVHPPREVPPPPDLPRPGRRD